MPQFLFEVLQALCLGFVHLPDIGPIPLQIIKLKLVQRCETHIEAQSCKGSYGFGFRCKQNPQAFVNQF